MKYFIAVLALAAVASARVLDNHFLPAEGQFDIHPAVDVIGGSQVAQSAGSPLVQIILNIESNDAAPSAVAPILQPIVEGIAALPVTLPVVQPIDVAPITLPAVLPIIPEAGQIVDTISVAEPIVPGQIVDTISIAEPIVPGQIVDTISIAQPIVPVPAPAEPIGIIGIPEILN